MSRQNGEESNQQVIDEEGDVDSKVKDTIIQARDRVDETKNALDVQAPLQPDINLSPQERTHIFAKTVKQFLIRIEPLLRADEIGGNEAYYEGDGNPIATFTLVPPDTEGYQFSLVRRDISDENLRKMIGLPRGIDLPEPREVIFMGLKDIIEKPMVVSHEWEVCVDRSGAPPNWNYVYPHTEQLVPEQVYLDALRDADQFLQDIGIGVETGLPEVDERAEPF